MKIYKSILIILIIFCTSCTPSITEFRPQPDQKINPVGLFVVASSHVISDEERAYQEFVVKEGERQILSIFRQKGFQMVSLNPVIPTEEVYTTMPNVFWFINESKIATYAREHNCPTVLIVQYYLDSKLHSNWLNLHDELYCVIRAWLVRTTDAKMLTEDRYRVACKYSGIFDLNGSEQPKDNREPHSRYIKHITEIIFGDVVPMLTPRDELIQFTKLEK